MVEKIIYNFLIMKKALGFIVVGILIGSGIAFAATKVFTDVPEDTWYTDAVESLADKGIVEGYPDGTFGPGRNVNRAEMAVIIDRLIEYIETGEVTQKTEVSNFAKCEEHAGIMQFVTGEFRYFEEYDKGGGDLTLSGYIDVEEWTHFGEDPSQVVVLLFSPENLTEDQKQAFARDRKREGLIVFRLGGLENDTKIKSTSNISPLAESEILSAMETGEEITLDLEIPIWYDFGPPVDFSQACAIRKG